MRRVTELASDHVPPVARFEYAPPRGSTTTRNAPGLAVIDSSTTEQCFEVMDPDPIPDNTAIYQSMSSTTLKLDTERAFGILADEEARRILSFLDEPRTTHEIAKECGIPRSNAYRKIEILDDAGLVRNAIRLQPSGGHPVTYRRAFDAVNLSMGGERVTLAFTREQESSQGRTDGG